MLADLDKIGIKGIDLWPRPFRQMTNSRRPITSPKDLAGLKFRVPNNPLWVEFFGKMGASPTPMAFAEVYNALQLKVVDGQENPINIPVTAKFYEVQKYASLTEPHGRWLGPRDQPGQVRRADRRAEGRRSTAAGRGGGLEGGQNDAADEGKSVEFLKSKGMEVNALTPEQQKPPSSQCPRNCSRSSRHWSKDQAFFDKTLSAVGKK